MFYSLVRKSLFGKYKNSALGFLWNFITPAISILLFYIVSRVSWAGAYRITGHIFA